MQYSNLELVSEAYTLVTLSDNSKVIFKINQDFLDKDPDQYETLLQPHQMRAFGIVVDNCASRHVSSDGDPGRQYLTVSSTKLGMDFDGWKCHFFCQNPTKDDLTNYKVIKVNSPREYTPQRRYLRRMKGINKVTVEEWRARLGYPTHEVTQRTLANTTNYVQSLQAETSEYMRDHYKTRVWALQPRRIDDVMYLDAFFSSVYSIRGFKYFQLFAFKAYKFERLTLMRREAQAPEVYEDCIRTVGALNKTVTDNVKVLAGNIWTSINCKYCTETGLTVPHHQHQNYSEGIGCNIKFAVLKLLHNTPHAPEQYWWYAASFFK